MIRRSKKSVDRETESLKEVFSKGGEEAIIEQAKKQAAKFYRPGHAVYKSEKEMAEGFAKQAMKKIGV